MLRIALDDWHSDRISLAMIYSGYAGYNRPAVDQETGYLYTAIGWNKYDGAKRTGTGLAVRMDLNIFGDFDGIVEFNFDEADANLIGLGAATINSEYVYFNIHTHNYENAYEVYGGIARVPLEEWGNTDAIEHIALTEINSIYDTFVSLDIIASDRHVYIMPSVDLVYGEYIDNVVRFSHESFDASSAEVIELSDAEPSLHGNAVFDFLDGNLYITPVTNAYNNKLLLSQINEEEFTADGVKYFNVASEYDKVNHLFAYFNAGHQNLLILADDTKFVHFNALKYHSSSSNRRLMSYIAYYEECDYPTYSVGPVCYDNNAIISCGYGVINVIDAFYGRREELVCASDEEDADLSLYKNTNCTHDNSKAIVAENCNGNSACDISASNEVFGEPCYGTNKYLELDYNCVWDFSDACIDFISTDQILACYPGLDGPIYRCADGYSGDDCTTVVAPVPHLVVNVQLIVGVNTGRITFVCDGPLIVGSVQILLVGPGGTYSIYINTYSPGSYDIDYVWDNPLVHTNIYRILLDGRIYYGGIPSGDYDCHVVYTGEGDGYPRFVNIGPRTIVSNFVVYKPVILAPGSEVITLYFDTQFKIEGPASRVEVHITWIGGTFDPDGPHVYTLDETYYAVGTYTYTINCGCLIYGGQYELKIIYWDPYDNADYDTRTFTYNYLPIDDVTIAIPPTISSPVIDVTAACGCAYVRTEFFELGWSHLRDAIWVKVYITVLEGTDVNAPYSVSLGSSYYLAGDHTITFGDIVLVSGVKYKLTIEYSDEHDNISDDQLDFIYSFGGKPLISYPSNNGNHNTKDVYVTFILPGDATSAKLVFSNVRDTDNYPREIVLSSGYLTEGTHTYELGPDGFYYGLQYSVKCIYNDVDDFPYESDVVTFTYTYKLPPVIIAPIDNAEIKVKAFDFTYTLPIVAYKVFIDITIVSGTDANAPYHIEITDKVAEGEHTYVIDEELVFQNTYNIKLTYTDKFETDYNVNDNVNVIFAAGPPIALEPVDEVTTENVIFKYELPQVGKSVKFEVQCTSCSDNSVSEYEFTSSSLLIVGVNTWQVTHEFIFEQTYKITVSYIDTDDVDGGSDYLTFVYKYAGPAELIAPAHESYITDQYTSITYKLPTDAKSAQLEVIELDTNNDANDPYIISLYDNDLKKGTWTHTMDTELVFNTKYTFKITYTDNYDNTPDSDSNDATYMWAPCPQLETETCTSTPCFVNVADSPCPKRMEFTVPLGVYVFHFELLGGKSPSGNSGFEVTGALRVSPNDHVLIDIGGFVLTNPNSATASTIKVNDEIVVLATGGGENATGGTLLDAQGGQGYDSSKTNIIHENGLSYVEDGVIQLAYNDDIETRNRPNGDYFAYAYTSWQEDCPEGFTLLHSDYDPELLPDSSLYVRNGEPALEINVKLPYYYYDTEFEYIDQCDEKPSVLEEVHGCWIHYHTSINYVDHCQNFTLEEDSTTDDYRYAGTLTVKALLNLIMEGYEVTRRVSSPINWQVYLQKTITVDYSVEIINDHVCVTEAECNNNGCCEDGFCNCDCTEFGNGFSGKYCSDDITPPTCDAGFEIYNISSPHGGCIKAITRDLLNERVYSDNSNDTVILNRIYNADTGDLITNEDEYCFDIGTTEIIYEIKDSSDNIQNCSYTINVADDANPVADCHQCQTETANEQVVVCTGNNNNWSRQIMSWDDFIFKSSDNGIIPGYWMSYLPGQYIDLDNDRGLGQKYQENDNIKFINCDCSLSDKPVNPTYLTNTWNSWGIPLGFDTTDGVISLPSISEPADGTHVITYTALDNAGNSATCDINVTYDATPPTCEGFSITIGVDPNNKNYSLPVEFDDVVFNASISGIDQLPLLYPERTSGDIYHVGYAYNATYRSTYNLTDLAGNVGTCPWEVIVDNPEPCIYPVCDDLPPYLISGTCPNNIIMECDSLDSCGCLGFNDPQFKDDKYVQRIEVYVNDELFETYNNDPNSDSTFMSEKLSLGLTNVKYIAYDMHNQTAECEFSVTVNDQVAPIFNNCPNDTIIELDTTATDDFSYEFSSADACVLNEDLTYTTNTYPLVPSLDNNGHPSDTVTLDINSNYTFSYTVSDTAGNTNTCDWIVEVRDTGKPVISCPADIVQRIQQGSTSTIISFIATATDNSNDDITITYSTNPNTAFIEGTYTITATAYDSAGNSDQCSFDIEVLAPYPFATIDAALVTVIVNEIADETFGAFIQFETYSPNPHRIRNATSDSNGIISSITESRADCNINNPICTQRFDFNIQFDSCSHNGVEYELALNSYCQPTDCIDNKVHNILIELTAANYCWQDLASIDISADLITVSKSTLDLYISDYNSFKADPANNMKPDLPSTETLFYNDAEVSGIAYVSSNQVYFDTVEIKALNKEHYTDSGFIDSVANYDIFSQSTLTSDIDYASFTYTEVDIPLETVWFTRYTATLELSYDFTGGFYATYDPDNSSSRRRRRLLQVETTTGLDEIRDTNGIREVVADAVILSDFINNNNDDVTTIDPNDAIISVFIPSCTKDDISITNEFQLIFANYLRIDLNRIFIEFDTSSCFMSIQIKQTDCQDTVDIITLLDYFEQGITDTFSQIHQDIYANEHIPYDIVLDPKVFYIVQIPENIITHDEHDIQQVHATSDINEDETMLSKQLYWIIYVLAGFIVSLLLYKIKQTCTTKTIIKTVVVKEDNLNLIKQQMISAQDDTENFHADDFVTRLS